VLRPAPLDVVVAHGRPAVRLALTAALALEDDLRVVALAHDIATTVRAVHALAPAVLVLELALLGSAGFGRLALLRPADASLGLVALGMTDHPGYAARAVRAGASGYVLMDTADTELAPAVRRAARAAHRRALSSPPPPRPWLPTDARGPRRA
jgi:DNA-binding NarL/FixJ family response regulator